MGAEYKRLVLTIRLKTGGFRISGVSGTSSRISGCGNADCRLKPVTKGIGNKGRHAVRSYERKCACIVCSGNYGRVPSGNDIVVRIKVRRCQYKSYLRLQRLES